MQLAEERARELRFRVLCNWAAARVLYVWDDYGERTDEWIRRVPGTSGRTAAPVDRVRPDRASRVPGRPAPASPRSGARARRDVRARHEVPEPGRDDPETRAVRGRRRLPAARPVADGRAGAKRAAAGRLPTPGVVVRGTPPDVRRAGRAGPARRARRAHPRRAERARTGAGRARPTLGGAVTGRTIAAGPRPPARIAGPATRDGGRGARRRAAADRLWPAKTAGHVPTVPRAVATALADARTSSATIAGRAEVPPAAAVPARAAGPRRAAVIADCVPPPDPAGRVRTRTLGRAGTGMPGRPSAGPHVQSAMRAPLDARRAATRNASRCIPAWLPSRTSRRPRPAST